MASHHKGPILWGFKFSVLLVWTSCLRKQSSLLVNLGTLTFMWGHCDDHIKGYLLRSYPSPAVRNAGANHHSVWFDFRDLNKCYIQIEQWCSNYMGYISSYNQAPLRTRQSVGLSVRLSVCVSVCLSVCLSVKPFSQWSSHRIIILPMTKLMSMKKVKVRGQRWRSQRSKSNHFRTVTPVWIHIWWWNDAQSLMLLRRGTLLFFKVICQISWSHG